MNNITPPKTIILSDEEKNLVTQIDFTPDRFANYDTIQDSCAIAGKLTRILLTRNGIPHIRWQYFTDPSLSIGSKKSHKEIFEANGTKGNDIFFHPHFLKFLQYFIYGPDLPTNTIKEFCNIANHFPGTSGMQLDRFQEFVRAEIRQQSLDKHFAAEEFYKLALECNLSKYLARSIRDAAMSTR